MARPNRLTRRGIEYPPQHMNHRKKPTIAITMGDPAGVGPELCLKLITDAATLAYCTPIIFGDADLLIRVAGHLDLQLPEHIVAPEDWPQVHNALKTPAILDFHQIPAADVQPGTVNAQTGIASYSYINAAIAAAVSGEVDAISTGPINKEAIHAAGIPYPGHTEMLEKKTNAKRICMMLTSEEITCSVVTAHVGYREVPNQLTSAAVLDAIELSHDAMKRIRGRDVHLIVCGLNPHAGEHGLFGNGEEETIIAPAVRAAQKNGISIEGPLPPDTAFLPANRQRTDCYICMYHDQGLIPLKALAFDKAVNVTLGLPIIRTSVDHGTACDIAWKGIADVSSFIEATKLATKLAIQP